MIINLGKRAAMSHAWIIGKTTGRSFKDKCFASLSVGIKAFKGKYKVDTASYDTLGKLRISPFFSKMMLVILRVHRR